MCEQFSMRGFSLLKFEPENILLLHKDSKKVYHYYPLKDQSQPHHQIIHHALLRPLLFSSGLLYPKCPTTLENQLNNRRRAHNIVYFTEDQLVNTFLPILQCLQILHLNGITHGAVSPTNIFITDEQDIKLRDWQVEDKENMYYFHKKKKDITKEDDLIALGQIIAQATTLRKGNRVFTERQLYSILETVIDHYSKGFVFALSVFIQKNYQRFDHLKYFLKNEEKYLTDIELNSLYQNVKKEKMKKQISMSTMENIMPQNQNSLKPSVICLGSSPVKKVTVLGAKKTVKEDNQNKKVYNEEIKKKQIEKINKIIERSNQFVSELMSRKNKDSAVKKVEIKQNSINISTFGLQNSQRKLVKESVVTSSPLKKVRTVSKKK